MATIGCGIICKDKNHTDKCSKNITKATQKQNEEATDKYFFQNTVNTKMLTKYTYII
jgi:hypothetical protein